MFNDELGVFYGAGDFAHVCVRSRPGENDATFNGILATADESLFGGNVQAGVHTLRYITAAAALDVDDVVRTQRQAANGTLGAATVWRVLRAPERVVEGAESRVYIKPDPEA